MVLPLEDEISTLKSKLKDAMDRVQQLEGQVVFFPNKTVKFRCLNNLLSTLGYIHLKSVKNNLDTVIMNSS